MQVTILYQLRVANTVSRDRWGYKLQNFAKAAPPANKPISYIQYETNRTCQQLRLCFAWILPILRIIIFPIIDQCKYFFIYFYDKALILKRYLILSNANTKIWSKKMSIGPYVAKTFFLQSRQTKISGYTGVWYKNV